MLKSAFGFGFLKEYGTVFKVFEDQDPGNICFGMEKDRQHYFIKFIDTFTGQYGGALADAVTGLMAILPVYRDLQHRNLVELLKRRI